MIVTVRGADAVRQMLSTLEQRQIPYAISKGLNAVADDCYDAVKRHVSQHFVLRQPAFILGRYRRLPYDSATRTRLKVTVYQRRFVRTELPGGVLAKFVEGGVKTGRGYPVAIPTQAIRPSFRQLVPRYLTPKALGLQHGRYTVPAGSVGKSKRSQAARYVKPFILDPSKAHGLGPKAWGIYRRVGPGRGNIEMIWAFRHVIPIPKRLPFEAIVRAETDRMYDLRMGQALQAAIASAGYKGVYGPRRA